MYVYSTITPADFETALKAARDVGVAGRVPGLAAPLSAGLLGRITAAWEGIEEALRRAWEIGYAGAKEIVERAVDKAERIMADAGDMARDIRQAIVLRLQSYLNTLTDTVLSQVRSGLTIGQTTLVLSSVELGRKVGLSGSLKASLTEIAGMTGSGEININAIYRAP